MYVCIHILVYMSKSMNSSMLESNGGARNVCARCFCDRRIAGSAAQRQPPTGNAPNSVNSPPATFPTIHPAMQSTLRLR